MRERKTERENGESSVSEGRGTTVMGKSLSTSSSGSVLRKGRQQTTNAKGYVHKIFET